MHRHLLTIALLASWSCAAAPASTDDTLDITRVVESFKHAIVYKDEQAFLGLFLHNGVTWQSVMSDAVFDRVRTRDPDATRAAYRADRSPRQFIQDIADSPARVEETFENVQIDTDGAVASVSFDFTFRRDRVVINVGREYWLLVKTDAGWKIASVVWSRSR